MVRGVLAKQTQPTRRATATSILAVTLTIPLCKESIPSGKEFITLCREGIPRRKKRIAGCKNSIALCTEGLAILRKRSALGKKRIALCEKLHFAEELLEFRFKKAKSGS